MSTKHTVLLVGGTGRTGRRVLEQLLRCDIGVRAIVRSANRLPTGAAQDPRLEIVEADLLSLSDENLLRSVRGCDAVISCLGHVLSLKGILARRATCSRSPAYSYDWPGAASAANVCAADHGPPMLRFTHPLG